MGEGAAKRWVREIARHIYQKAQILCCSIRLVPEPKDPHSGTIKLFRSLGVVFLLICFGMTATIKFNREKGIMTVIIQNISAYRMLTTEFEPAETAGP